MFAQVLPFDEVKFFDTVLPALEGLIRGEVTAKDLRAHLRLRRSQLPPLGFGEDELDTIYEQPNGIMAVTCTDAKKAIDVSAVLHTLVVAFQTLPFPMHQFWKQLVYEEHNTPLWAVQSLVDGRGLYGMYWNSELVYLAPALGELTPERLAPRLDDAAHRVRAADAGEHAAQALACWTEVAALVARARRSGKGIALVAQRETPEANAPNA